MLSPIAPWPRGQSSIPPFHHSSIKLSPGEGDSRSSLANKRRLKARMTKALLCARTSQAHHGGDHHRHSRFAPSSGKKVASPVTFPLAELSSRRVRPRRDQSPPREQWELSCSHFSQQARRVLYLPE